MKEQTLPETVSEQNRATIHTRDRDDETHINDILDEVYNQNWKNHVLVMLITAGPVTYIGLQVGYYVGYGKFADLNVFIYFAIFTIVAGLLGLFVRILDSVNNNKQQYESEQQIKVVIDGVFNTLIALKNNRILAQDPDDRKYDAALEVFKNPHAEVRAIECAVFTITENKHLSNVVAEIEVYRRSGLMSYVGDIVKRHADEINKVCDEVREIRPDAADWLSYRLSGLAPTMREGLERNEGFIERILAWIDNDEDSIELLRPRDGEEIVTFAFELLVGREIPVLSIEFQGNMKLNQAVGRLNNARNRYRVALGARFSRIKALSRFFHLDEKLDEFELRDASVLLQHIHEELDRKSKALKAVKVTDKTKRQRHVQKTELKIAINLYKEILVAERRVNLRNEQLKKALQEWTKVSSKHDINFENDNGNKYLTIARRIIRLNNYEKVRFAKFMYPFFDNQPDPSFWPPEQIHKFLIGLVEILDELIFLGHAERQRAIESSSAANLGWLESGFSAVGKMTHGSAAISEVKNDLSRPAERMFRALVSQYNVSASDEMMQFFEERYNARPHILENMMETLTPESKMPSLTPPEKLHIKPKLKASWSEGL